MPLALASRLAAAPSGTRLYGMVSIEDDVCSITAVEYSAPPRCDSALLGLKGDQQEQELVRKLGLPIFVDHGNTLYSGDTVCDIIEYGDEDVARRNPLTRAQREHLTNKRVLILGQGSGGTGHALHLACAGVGHLTLCDFDVLKPHNIQRDRRDFRYLGLNKARATALLLRHCAPLTQTKVVADDVTLIARTRQLRRLVNEHDLVVGATDSHRAHLRLQAVCLLENRPFVAVGCHQEARSGEIFFHVENSPACLYCAEGPPESTTPRAGDYGLSEEERAAMPALGSAIEHVVGLGSSLLVGFLLIDSAERPALSQELHRRVFVDGAQLLAIGGPLVDEKPTHGAASPILVFQRPFHTRWCKFARDPECELCVDPAAFIEPAASC